MRLFLPMLAIVACEPVDETELCSSGIRETWTSTVTLTNGGGLNVQTNHCVRTGWSWAECAAGNEDHCFRFFGQNQPPVTPVSYVYGDFVFNQAIGHMQVQRPSIIGNNVDLQLGLTAARDELLPLGYEVGAIQPTAAIDDHPAYRMRVSCEHPDVNELCPFTWEYLLVDLGTTYPDLYADLTMTHAAWIDASDVTAIYPEEFDHYQQMIDSMHLSVVQ